MSVLAKQPVGGEFRSPEMHSHSPATGRYRTSPAGLRVLPLVLFSLAIGPAVGAHESNSVEIQRLTEKIAAAPNTTELYLRRAEMQRLVRHWHAAEADYQRAAALDPQLAVVDLAFGTMWIDAGHAERALPLLNRYVARQPTASGGRIERARALRMLKQWAAAAADFAAAVDHSPAPEPRLFADWAATLAEAGDQAEALAVLNRGLARLGPVATLEMKALDLEESLHHFEAALQRLTTLLAHPGRKESLLLRQATILLAAGRQDEARAAVALARQEFSAVPEARRLTAAGQQLAIDITRLESRTTALSQPSNPDASDE